MPAEPRCSCRRSSRTWSTCRSSWRSSWQRRWPYVALAAVLPAWLAADTWQHDHPAAADWKGAMALAAALYAVFVAYPFVLNRRARDSRDPYFTAVLGSVFFFFAARRAFLAGGLQAYVGIIPVAEGVVMALILRAAAARSAGGERDLGRLALVAAASLVVRHRRDSAAAQQPVDHDRLGARRRGALVAVPPRAAQGPAVCRQRAARGGVRAARAEPGDLRLRAARQHADRQLVSLHLSDRAASPCCWPPGGCRRPTIGSLPRVPRASSLLPAGAVIVLFILLNIEVADFYATGPEITFRFGVDARAGPHLHALLAGLRARPAHGGDLPAQSLRAESPPSRSSR